MKSTVGIGVSAFLIWWVLRGQDLGEGFAQISQTNPWYFVASLAVGTAGYLIRAWRWKVLLHPLKPDTALRSRFAGITIGFAITNLVGLRMGEIPRAFALTRLESITLSGSLGSLVVERFLDVMVLGTLLLVPMALPSFPGAEGLLSGTVGGGSSVRQPSCSRWASWVWLHWCSSRSPSCVWPSASSADQPEAWVRDWSRDSDPSSVR